MDQSALDSPQASPEPLRTLASQFVNHQRSIENHVLNTAIAFWLLCRLSLEPASWPGRLAAGVLHFLMVLSPALIITAITADGFGTSLISWTIVAVSYGGGWSVVPLGPYTLAYSSRL